MITRRSLLVGSCTSACIAGVAAQSPDDVVVGKALAERFVTAGIPVRAYSLEALNMEPTLRLEDVVLVDLRPSGQLPKRGDIIAYLNSGAVRLMRAVGMPGEKVSTGGGRLVIDATIVPRERIDDYIGKSNGRPFSVPRYKEVLPGGSSHEIIHRLGGNRPFDYMGVFSVPSDSIFVLGDNRDQSLDSRELDHGFVPIENVIGRAVYRFWHNPAWLVAESTVPGL